MSGTNASKKPQVKLQLLDSKKESLGLVGVVFYSVCAAFLLTYSAYLFDKEGFASKTKGISGVQDLVTVFEVIETFSPFHEFIDDDLVDRQEPEKPEAGKGGDPAKNDVKKSKRKVFTADELKKYDGSSGKGPYLALLGQVFDVSKGAQHYGPGGGYAFFSGRDASRAFVTGKFDEEGLTDDVMGLELDEYSGLDDWVKFYRKDYKRIGVLEGRYFDSDGQQTEYSRHVRDLIESAKDAKAARLEEHDVFPPCNSAWSQTEGHKVWCTTKSGGIDRLWAGVPRRLFTPGREQERCACVKDTGTPLNPSSPEGKERGDLDHPHLKEYKNCDPKSDTCVLSAPGESMTSKEETNSEPPEDDDIADADLDELSAQDLKTMHLHH